MRRYAPAPVEAVLDGLLDEPSLASGVLHHEVIPARAGPDGADPGLARPADPAGPRRARYRGPVHPPGGGDRGRPGRSRHRRRHADRVGQDPVLHAAGPPGARRGSVGPGPLPLPHQGPRPGPGGRVRRARPGRRAGHLRRDLRRRHAGADPLGDPDGGPGRGDEPGHAQLRDPPPPHEVVPALRAAPDHRHRRAPHVPGDLRQPRGQRPAPAAPAVRPLRLAPDRRVLLGHDRQPGRAGGHPDRSGCPADRPERRPVRASATSCSSSRPCSIGRPAPAARP